ncbi:MAG: CRISPR-associated helicase Cas3' [Thermoanaerobaculia bacterium]
MKGHPTGYWAKLEERDGEVVAWHPLEDHSVDVAACAEALLEGTILGPRLAALGGLRELSRSQVSRLATLAALHDAGKHNNGFQNRALPRPPFRAGHLSEILGLLLARRRYERRGELRDALRARELVTWSEGIEELLAATFSHHGTPVDPDVPVLPHWWQVYDGRDPIAGVAALTERTRTWFPEAWAPEADSLPEAPAFQHAWAGLLMLADWIGSDSERFFPFTGEGDGDRMAFARERSREALARLGLDAAPARRSLGPALPAYEWARGEWPEPDAEPRPAQRKVLELPRPEEGSVVVLEAATGSGKTEAAVAHFFRLFHDGRVDGLYFALPTRTAATQIHGRVVRAVQAAFPEGSRPPVVLAVPGYLRVDEHEGRRLPGFQVQWFDDPARRLRDRGWAAEHGKRYLAGAVVVGTIDQVLLSTLTLPHAHLRASALLRHLLVVDEVHASDLYMNRLLEWALDQHVAAGGHAFLMSATLGAGARTRLLAPPGRRAKAKPPPLADAVDLPYPALSVSVAGKAPELLPVEGRPEPKRVLVERVPWMEAPEKVADRALRAAREGARVAVVRNTVAGCRALQAELEALAGEEHRLLFRCNELPAPHHARFAAPDRKRLDRAVEEAFGRNRPTGGCVVAATQTIEQSLDLDADLLITDLAPLDVLLQRIGRLHRHRRADRPAGYETARVVVLVPEERDLATLIRSDGEARGPHGLGTVYEDLRVLEATWRTLVEDPELDLPAQNRRLVERATHPEVLAGLVEEGGAAWERHEQHLTGKHLAEGRKAGLNRLRRDKNFSDAPFPRREDKPDIATRLGEDDRLARFDPPVTSPFGERITELALPDYWTRGVPADVDAAEGVTPDGDAFTFSYGPCPFRYDRWGVRPAEESGK